MRKNFGAKPLKPYRNSLFVMKIGQRYTPHSACCVLKMGKGEYKHTPFEL